jgi:hypothetical protein
LDPVDEAQISVGRKDSYRLTYSDRLTVFGLRGFGIVTLAKPSFHFVLVGVDCVLRSVDVYYFGGFFCFNYWGRAFLDMRFGMRGHRE